MSNFRPQTRTLPYISTSSWQTCSSVASYMYSCTFLPKLSTGRQVWQQTAWMRNYYSYTTTLYACACLPMTARLNGTILICLYCLLVPVVVRFLSPQFVLYPTSRGFYLATTWLYVFLVFLPLCLYFSCFLPPLEVWCKKPLPWCVVIIWSITRQDTYSILS